MNRHNKYTLSPIRDYASNINGNDNNKHHFNSGSINDNSLLKHYYSQIKRQYNSVNTSNPVLPVIEKTPVEVTNAQENELIFSNGNKRYLLNYKKYIETKSNLIDSNSEKYLSYMSRELSRSPHRRRDQHQPLRSESFNNGPATQVTSSHYLRPSRDNPQQMSSIGENDHFKANSFQVFTPGIIKSHHSDINNPNYYRDSSENTIFAMLKEKQRQILQYNKDIMDIRSRHKRNEVDPNPYRSYNTTLGKSYLTNNTILNPVPNVAYNKYMVHF